MTDNEIIKALSCCIRDNGCEECPFLKKCFLFYDKPQIGTPEILMLSLDLINRKKAEIERLNDKVKRLQESVRLMLNYDDGDERIKSEARKEFAERLKENRFEVNDLNEDIFFAVDISDIDNLVKEMEKDK